MSTITRSGFTGPFHIGPTAIYNALAGATQAAATNGGTALVPTSGFTQHQRLNDGFHYATPFFPITSVAPPAKVYAVHDVLPTPLDAVIFVMALCALIASGRAAAQIVALALENVQSSSWPRFI
jgi:hypothetical protein